MPEDVASFRVRIPKWLHQELKDSAAAGLRSMNSQLIILLTEALKERESKKIEPRR